MQYIRIILTFSISFSVGLFIGFKLAYRKLSIKDANTIIEFIHKFIDNNYKKPLVTKVLMKKLMIFTDTDINNAIVEIKKEVILIFNKEYKIKTTTYVDSLITKTIKEYLYTMATQHNTEIFNNKSPFSKRK